MIISGWKFIIKLKREQFQLSVHLADGAFEIQRESHRRQSNQL